MSNTEPLADYVDWVLCIRRDPWTCRAQSVNRIVDPFASAGALAEGGPAHVADR